MTTISEARLTAAHYLADALVDSIQTSGKPVVHGSYEQHRALNQISTLMGWSPYGPTYSVRLVMLGSNSQRSVLVDAIRALPLTDDNLDRQKWDDINACPMCGEIASNRPSFTKEVL